MLSKLDEALSVSLCMSMPLALCHMEPGNLRVHRSILIAVHLRRPEGEGRCCLIW